MCFITGYSSTEVALPCGKDGKLKSVIFKYTEKTDEAQLIRTSSVFLNIIVAYRNAPVQRGSQLPYLSDIAGREDSLCGRDYNSHAR